jgi:hypothetical protein
LWSVFNSSVWFMGWQGMSCVWFMGRRDGMCLVHGMIKALFGFKVFKYWRNNIVFQNTLVFKSFYVWMQQIL